MILTVEELCQKFKEYLVVDIRSERCYHLYHIPYSVQVKLHQKYILNTNKLICFVCIDGQASQQLAQGVVGSYCLEGGIQKWVLSNCDECILKQCAQGECCEGDECCPR